MSNTLIVHDLHLARGKERVVRGVDLRVEPGEICVLMGASGAGKSTVLRAIVALQPFQCGSISLGDVVLLPGPVPPQRKLKPLRQRVGMVFQSHSLFEHLTALDNVTIAPMHALGWTRVKAEDVARKLLESLGVAHRASALPHQLSGGEAQRVAIARALAPDPGTLLMDEPTSALDPARREALGDTLRALAREGRALLIATHDSEFAREYADRTLVLADGRIDEASGAKR
ncbi:MAG: ATP-binding cassette domain-containing protein [bacterium]